MAFAERISTAMDATAAHLSTNARTRGRTRWRCTRYIMIHTLETLAKTHTLETLAKRLESISGQLDELNSFAVGSLRKYCLYRSSNPGLNISRRLFGIENIMVVARL